MANARQLAIQSEFLGNQKGFFLERRALLSAESMIRNPSVEADQALRDSLSKMLLPVSSVGHGQTDLGIQGITVSPDNKYIASSSADGKDTLIILSNLITGQEINRLSIESNPYTGKISFSPDGNILGIATNNSIHLWKWNSHESPLVIEGRAYIAFDSTGDYVAAVSLYEGGNASSNVAKVFATRTGRLVARLENGTGTDEDKKGSWVEDLEFCPGDAYLPWAHERIQIFGPGMRVPYRWQGCWNKKARFKILNLLVTVPGWLQLVTGERLMSGT